MTQNTPGWWQRCITTMLTLHFISLALILVSDWYKGHRCVVFILCDNIVNFVITLSLFPAVVDFLNCRLYPSCSWDCLYRNSSSAFTFSPGLQATSASLFVPASNQLVSMQLINSMSVVLLTKQCWFSSCRFGQKIDCHLCDFDDVDSFLSLDHCGVSCPASRFFVNMDFRIFALHKD